MNGNLSTIPSDASAKEAAIKMLDDLVSSLIVVEGENYIGILTNKDITQKLVALGLDPNETEVEAIMQSPLITLDASLPMDEALLLMKKNISDV